MNAQKLQWPTGWKRTPVRAWSKFATQSPATKNRKRTLTEAVAMLQAELDRLGAKEAILSTNLDTRIDGLPRGGQAQPADPGVALYFVLNGRKMVLACDRWIQVQCNIYALAKHIEALRGQERWGVGSIEQAFTGYTALPAPGEGTGSKAWTVLGIPVGSDVVAIRAAFKALAMSRHPDRGGNPDAWFELNEALNDALAQSGKGGKA